MQALSKCELNANLHIYPSEQRCSKEPYNLEHYAWYIYSSEHKSCATSGAGTAHPSGAHEFTPGFVVGFVLLDA